MFGGWGCVLLSGSGDGFLFQTWQVPLSADAPGEQAPGGGHPAQGEGAAGRGRPQDGGQTHHQDRLHGNADAMLPNGHEITTMFQFYMGCLLTARLVGQFQFSAEIRFFLPGYLY